MNLFCVYDQPDTVEFHLSKYPVMLDVRELWNFCHSHSTVYGCLSRVGDLVGTTIGYHEELFCSWLLCWRIACVSSPSCPCCIFLLGDGLFLPRKDGAYRMASGGGRSALSKNQLLLAHVIDPREACDRISSAPHGEATASRQKIM
jgi:hypothetical protein